MENLLTFLHTLTDFSEESWNTLQPALTTVQIKKGAYLLETGKVCNSLFFISEGYCRAFHDKEKQEINTAFYFENDIATNINSFSKNEKSEYSIQACEQMTVVIFDKQKLFEACKIAPEIDRLGRKCMEVFASKQEEHADLFKLMTGQERYEYLEKKRPDILQRVSLTQISSYIGVARETLSRIRNKKRGKTIL